MIISTNPPIEGHGFSLNSSISNQGSECTALSIISRGPSTGSSPDKVATSPSFTSISDGSSADSHFSDTERERLRLMHNYTLHTAKSLVELSIPEDRDQTIWMNFAVELALENDLVLHGLLSLSALHLALQGVSKRKNTILAVHHHDVGLALFRSNLSNITGHNYDCIFAFNCINMLYAFGIQRCSESTTNALERIHQVLTLIYNSRPITKSHMEMLKRSRWSVMMLPEPWPSLEQRLPDEMETMLARLIQRASVTATTAKQAEIYITVIQALRYVLILTSISRPAQVCLVMFSMMAPVEYWDLIQRHDPLALAVLANYAVSLYWLGGNVWLEGWGKETIDAVHAVLAPEWHDCIAWALRETETSMDQ